MKITRFGLLTILLLGCLGASWTLLDFEQGFLDPPNYTRIEKGLYLGGYVKAPPPGTKAVLNLCEREDPYKCEHHVWAKVPDREPAPKLEWLGEQVAFIAKERKAGRTVYVHCMNGASRAPMVMCAFLMAENNWTRDKTLAYLRERRPQVRPNPAFMELLAEWQKALKRSADRRKSS